MSSHKRLRWLLVIVLVELVVIIGLVVWAVTRPANETQTDKSTANNTETVKEGPLATSLVATDLGVVTDIASVPIEGDKRLFAAERAGTIKVIDKNSGGVTPFLDLSAKVKDDGGEMGLLGLVFHPDFPENGYFFVNYVDKNDTTTVARFQVNAGGLADAGSEKIILTVKQPYLNHNAGGLAFGPDGFLYVAMGDGGSGGDPENRAQNKAELLGKLLRINVDTDEPYTVPDSNPFVGEEGARPEIWALGLRNPWRITFDYETNNLYIADVGQGEIEEVDMQPASSKGGENYGWRCYEGTRPYNTEGCQPADQYVKPIFEYTHENGRCSITGGYAYRGGNIGSLYGKYIYGDLCSGEIFAAEQKDGQWAQNVILKTPYTISTFGQDADRELYVADIESGSIYRLQTDQIN